MNDSAPALERGLVAPRNGNAKALLHEMVRLLEGLRSGGEGGSIDLRTVPLTHDDLTSLRSILGAGAVDARIEALGESHVRETRFPGIWWVTHCNEAGEVVAEAIEICAIPAILLTPVEDMADGAERLRQELAESARTGS